MHAVCCKCGGTEEVAVTERGWIPSNVKLAMRAAGWREVETRGWFCPTCINRFHLWTDEAIDKVTDGLLRDLDVQPRIKFHSVAVVR